MGVALSKQPRERNRFTFFFESSTLLYPGGAQALFADVLEPSEEGKGGWEDAYVMKGSGWVRGEGSSVHALVCRGRQVTPPPPLAGCLPRSALLPRTPTLRCHLTRVHSAPWKGAKRRRREDVEGGRERGRRRDERQGDAASRGCNFLTHYRRFIENPSSLCLCPLFSLPRMRRYWER